MDNNSTQIQSENNDLSAIQDKSPEHQKDHNNRKRSTSRSKKEKKLQDYRKDRKSSYYKSERSHQNKNYTQDHNDTRSKSRSRDNRKHRSHSKSHSTERSDYNSNYRSKNEKYRHSERHRNQRSPSTDSNGDPKNSKNYKYKSRNRSRSPYHSSRRNRDSQKNSQIDNQKSLEKRTRLPKTGGGRYIPPARLRQIEAERASTGAVSALTEKEIEINRQKEAWEKLKKGIRGLVNKVNTGNVKSIVTQLFDLNLIRGRGLLCRSIIRAQTQSPTYTPVYASLISVINTRLPLIGDLLVTRLVTQFRKAFQRDDKARCLATTQFLAHLTNQRVAHEILAFQVLQLLLENPTDDSVEVAVSFMKEVGSFLSVLAPRVLNAVIETFRSILHEAEIDKRVQYMIEVLLQVRREGFKDNVSVPEGLDLVEENDQIVHEIGLDDEELDVHDELDVFKFDDEYQTNEEKYNTIKHEILGESDGSESDSESNSNGDESESDSGNESSDSQQKKQAESSSGAPIKDLTETELVNLRRTIYLTIMSSMSFEEASHKLLRIQIPENDLGELCAMVVECCSQERAYKSFYGLVGERLCKVKNTLRDAFCHSFVECYNNIHKYETNHLRHIARFFGHMLSTEAIPFTVFSCVSLTEEDTTASSRIFIKILMQDVSESMGLQKLHTALHDPEAALATSGMFPTDNPKNIRFAINYFTSIGLGALTEELREVLSKIPQKINAESSSDSGSGTSSDESSGTESDTESSSSSDESSSDSDSSSESESDHKNQKTIGKEVKKRDVSTESSSSESIDSAVSKSKTTRDKGGPISEKREYKRREIRRRDSRSRSTSSDQST
ncbi:hypothetical protein BB559_001554, partial [Furculomyces boomerangus]